MSQGWVWSRAGARFAHEVAAIGIVLLVAPLALDAATLSVNTADPSANPADGLCSLIEAINNANIDSDTTVGDCPAGSGADVIELSPGTVCTLTSSDNFALPLGPNGLPVIIDHLTIEGGGATIKRSSDASTPAFRILRVSGATDLTIEDVTLSNGRIAARRSDHTRGRHFGTQ